MLSKCTFLAPNLIRVIGEGADYAHPPIPQSFGPSKFAPTPLMSLYCSKLESSCRYFSDGADYAHHIAACPPRFENLAASLPCIITEHMNEPYLQCPQWKILFKVHVLNCNFQVLGCKSNGTQSMYHVVLETVPLFIQELQARLSIGSKFFLTKFNYHFAHC